MCIERGHRAAVQTSAELLRIWQEVAELLDKNHLYVNLSEIDDARFGVSEEDKQLNRAFYGEEP